MNALPYYPRYPRDLFDGTAGMPLELKGAYGLVLDLVYMMGERGLPDDPQFIAGHLGCSVRKWNGLRSKLIEAGKLTAEDGVISNSRADKVKIIQRSYRDKQAENARGPSKTNGLAEPAPTYTNIDTVVADATTGASASEPEPIFTSEVWSKAAAFLARHDVRNPRPILGKWIRDHGEAAVFSALAECNRIGVCEPVSWITATLRPRQKRMTGDDKINAAMRAAARFDAMDRGEGDDSVIPLLPALRDSGNDGGGNDGLDQDPLDNSEKSHLRRVR